ncbi:hypothetical protein C8A00DRAFT_15550 [Chaetomidium leptoderma]|uniref:F-box domain-containing protein n=1 Tax=Chaetomidium leptoderma TaxID=669021 RepID=A0AAN6VLZ7_9PEZI|nr:hypothetical protein C8A00DRAFT_15550 [Chaetomidium leptoderma]
MSLLRMPYELVSFVARHLDLADCRNLSFSCKTFQFLLYESNMAKLLLESKAPHSTEACEARVSKQYAYQLRRLMKRRDAVASVKPYLVANVAFAEGWLYEKGVLCYLRNLDLRMLDLHRSGSREMVVDIRQLLLQDLEESRIRHKYKIKLLHYSDNIVSCIYTLLRPDQPGRMDWLLVLNPLDGRTITIRQLDSISKPFVRNNDRFLYYGTATEPDYDGSEQWVISGFDIKAGAWLDRPLETPEAIGTDIGSTVCFEIFDGYFYCLSNQRSLDIEEVDWLSYYYCLRVPLTPDGLNKVEKPPEPQLWRRDHNEGPIDDRWTFMRMFKDETTGELKVVESRKEWLAGSITARRTYYTTAISFDDPDKDSETRRSSDASAAKTQQGAVVRRRPRDAHMVHPGDDNSTLTITLTKCPVRCYYSSCQTFIDLVDDSTSFDPRDQQLRIRGGTRCLRAPGETGQWNPLPLLDRDQNSDALLRHIDSLYRSESGIFWPPRKDPSVTDAALANLYAILNPPGYFGSPRGSWDERSMVYATGSKAAGGLKALVFVSWDPSIHLAGTAPYPGDLSSTKPRSCADGSHPRANLPLRPAAPTPPREEKDTGSDANLVSWRTFEPAKYREISRGYHFAR